MAALSRSGVVAGAWPVPVAGVGLLNEVGHLLRAHGVRGQSLSKLAGACGVELRGGRGSQRRLADGGRRARSNSFQTTTAMWDADRVRVHAGAGELGAAVRKGWTARKRIWCAVMWRGRCRLFKGRGEVAHRLGWRGGLVRCSRRRACRGIGCCVR